MKHPSFDIEDHDEGFLIRFRAVGSTLGPVEVVLSPEEVDTLTWSLDQARVFSGADE
jgi:hypothetical protein